METDIDIKDVSLMDVSTWHHDVDDTEALTRKHIPNLDIAKWLLQIRADAPNKAPVVIKGEEQEPTPHIDVTRSNQLLKIIACNLLQRFCVLTFNSNIEKVIDEYERRTVIY